MKTRTLPNLDSPAVRRILKTLAEQPNISARTLASRAAIAYTSLNGGGYLKALKRARKIHVSGWQYRADCGFAIALYSRGRRPNMPRPKVAPAARDSAGIQRLAEVIGAHDSLTYQEAAYLAELSPNTVANARYMDTLVVQKKAHISGWRRSRGGPFNPLYSPGPGVAAPMPVPLSPAEKSRRWRARQRLKKPTSVLKFLCQESWLKAPMLPPATPRATHPSLSASPSAG